MCVCVAEGVVNNTSPYVTTPTLLSRGRNADAGPSALALGAEPNGIIR